MNYNNLTWSHFTSAAAAGELEGTAVRRGMAGDRAQGTWVQFDVEVRPWDAHAGEGHRVASEAGDRAGRVTAVRFRAFGCPHVIAVADWLCLAAIGLPAAAVLPESVQALQERFEVPIEKLGRLLVVEDAWIAALSPPHLGI